MCTALPRQKKPGVRHLGEPQPTHLPEQFLRVSQCSYFLHSLALEKQMYSSLQGLSCQEVAVGAPECSQEPPGCALVAQLP